VSSSERSFRAPSSRNKLANLTELETRFESKWGKSGDVAELFGEAFVEVGDVETGLRWYERAVAAPDGRPP
jgi:hypothetical protein